MFPTVFGPIHTYGLMLLIGFYAGWLLALRRARKEGVAGKHISDMLVYTVVSGIIGARLLYVITEWNSFNSFADCFKIWQGGLVFYGGLAAGTVTLVIVIVRRRLSIPKIADILAPSIALGLVFGRIGCFAYGCCQGIVAEHFPLSVQFPGRFIAAGIDRVNQKILVEPDGSPAFLEHVRQGLIPIPKVPGPSHSLPVYPAQLMESFDSLLICLLLLFFFRHRKRYGEVFLLFGALYSLQRFFLEMIRADNPPLPFFFNLTISQAGSLAFGIFCVIMFIRSRLLPANVAAAKPDPAGRGREMKKSKIAPAGK